MFFGKISWKTPTVHSSRKCKQINDVGSVYAVILTKMIRANKAASFSKSGSKNISKVESFCRF